MVADVLAKSGLKPVRLELEITETAPLHDDEAILTVLRKLATIGVRVSMDDFGTGNTGLSYLHKFRFDTLKIDQSFVRKLGHGKEAELIVNAIVELSVSLNVQTIAEGIETEQQAAMLRSMNCAVGQGFLFGHPCSAERRKQSDCGTEYRARQRQPCQNSVAESAIWLIECLFVVSSSQPLLA